MLKKSSREKIYKLQMRDRFDNSTQDINIKRFIPINSIQKKNAINTQSLS